MRDVVGEHRIGGLRDASRLRRRASAALMDPMRLRARRARNGTWSRSASAWCPSERGTITTVGGDLRLGLVGCGRLAVRGYVPAIAHVPDMLLAAVVDPALERCELAAPGVPAFATAADLIATDSVDALVIASPAEAHVADARLAAAAGLPTLIEKPPAPTLAETLELAHLDPAPKFGFNRRFVTEVASLRSAIPAQSAIRMDLEMRTRSASWGSYVADDDALSNLGPHLIDLTRWLSGAEIVGVGPQSRRYGQRSSSSSPTAAGKLACSAPRTAPIANGCSSGPPTGACTVATRPAASRVRFGSGSLVGRSTIRSFPRLRANSPRSVGQLAVSQRRLSPARWTGSA